jgi:hypothetical protein
MKGIDMKAGRDDLQALVEQVRRAAGEAPPEPVLYALVSLAGDAERTHLLAGRERIEEGGTCWQVLVLTDTSLIWVEATGPQADWSLQMPESDQEMLTGWTRPLGSIKALHVKGAQSVDDFGPGGGPSNWEWECTWALDVDGVGLIQVPLVGYNRNGGRAEQLEAFAVAVRTVLA